MPPGLSGGLTWALPNSPFEPAFHWSMMKTSVRTAESSLAGPRPQAEEPRQKKFRHETPPGVGDRARLFSLGG